MESGSTGSNEGEEDPQSITRKDEYKKAKKKAKVEVAKAKNRAFKYERI